MAKCRCSTAECNCVIEGGFNVLVDGSGNASDPYVIHSSPSSEGTLLVADTTTLDLELSGAGSQIDPAVIRGNAIVGDLVKVADTGTLDMTVTGAGTLADPVVLSGEVPGLDNLVGGDPGDVLTKQPDGSWSPGPPCQVCDGSVYVAQGLMGEGIILEPLAVVIPTYADAAQLANVPVYPLPTGP